MECLEKLIKKDWLHPLTGDKLTEKDIIPLQRVRSVKIKILKTRLYCSFVLVFLKGGTGYATTNVNLQGKNARPVLQC